MSTCDAISLALMLPEYSAAANGISTHAALELEGDPASSSVPDTINVEVNGQAEHQQTSTDAAAEQVFMYLQVCIQKQFAKTLQLALWLTHSM